MANNWSKDWSDDKGEGEPKPPDEFEFNIIKDAKEFYTNAESWEASARVNFDYDYKFANADTHNKYQWDNDLVLARESEDKPCLTINKTAQHNLMIINDAKQNKPGVRIRPVSDEATFEGAQIYQELIYHIEYISSAENVYDNATTFQVEAGIGYWRIATDYISSKTFDQEIYIRRIKDPRSVYLDYNINEVDGSDAREAIIFEDEPKKSFKKKYPKFAEIGNSSSLGNNSDGWITSLYVKVAEYFKKEEKEDKLVTWTNPETKEQVLSYYSDLSDIDEQIYKLLRKDKDQAKVYQLQERDVLTDDIKWYKIAGDRIIDKGDWPGKYIPIVRLVGTETVIDGVLDRKGHTRALINAQQIYNYNTSANVEFGALQTKSPWIAPSQAIEGFEEYYKTANRVNHSYLPYNAIDEDGNPIPPPQRPAAPQASPAYVEQLKIAQNEMMMVSGQYQAQLGENENAKSGVAINARQRQGDRATYHFIDNQAIAIRLTGKILLDLIPKIYDTKRIKKILARDGTRMNVTIDPDHKGQPQDVTDPANPQMDAGQKIKEIIFNPDFGMYDVQADTGPSFATKRMETANALTQIATSDKNFLGVGGDILFRSMDFPDADILAQRYNRMIPDNIKGEGPDPKTEQIMQQAEAKINQLTALIATMQKDLADKDRQLTQSGQKIDLDFRRAAAQEARGDYQAESDRLLKLGNSEGLKGIEPVIKQLIQGMLLNGELNFKDDKELSNKIELSDLPEDAKLAPDGNYYINHPDGGFAKVEMQ